MFKTLKDLSDAVFKTASITDDVVQRTHKAAKEIRDCETLIQKATFQRHMAIVELVGLEMWNHGKHYEEMPASGGIMGDVSH